MKVAILGTENSHAKAFAELIQGNPKYADIELVGVYGYDDEANKALTDAGLVSYVAKDPHEFLGKVDGILCTARHGDHHYEYALPYIQTGVPCFIDKPFAVKEEYVNEMLDTAQAKGTLLCGGSSLKFMDESKDVSTFVKENTITSGYVCAPINMVNPYAGFYFYAEHLVAIMLSVFGENVKSVTAHCPDESKNRLSVCFDYGDYDVAGMYSSSYTYACGAFSDKEQIHRTAGDIHYCYERELDEFVQMVKTRKMPNTYKQLALPAKILRAIEQSYKQGKEIAL